MGRSVGLSPLVTLVSVAVVGVLFGGFAVILAIPIACVLATLVDVVVRQKDPKDEELPPLLFNRRSTDFYRDWDRIAHDAVGSLRAEAARHPDDKALTSLVGELATHGHAALDDAAVTEPRVHRQIHTVELLLL